MNTTFFRLLFLLLVGAVVPLSHGATYRTNIDQSGPPPGCFESPTTRARASNPADSGQIWDIVIMVNRWVDVGGWTGGYYTGPQPTGEVVRLWPGDSALLWWARGYQSVGQTQVMGYNWAEYYTVNVSLVPQQYQVTGSVTPAGAGSVSGTGEYTEGDTATLRASPHTGYRFDRWSGGLSGSNNPQSLPVNGPKTVTAHFSRLAYPLTVSVQGSGTVTGTRTYQHGEVATVTATPASGWRFNGFSGDASGSASSTTVLMNGPKAVTASFVRQTHNLTTTATSGGSVSAGGIFTHGSTVQVTAYPNANYRFTGWSGDASGTSNPASVTMNRDRTVQANFAPVTHRLSTNVQGGGSVNGAGTYNHGQSVTVTATPSAGWEFTRFSGNLSGSSPSGTVVMNRDRSVTAIFSRITHQLTVATQGSGTVTGAGSYNHGQSVTVTASPAAGWEFGGFSGDLTRSTPSGTVVMNADRSVTATFVRNEFTLTTQAESGGTVSPGGTFPAGTVVTVTATPNAQYDFVGWVGDASGSNPVVNVVINRAKTVRARFTPKQFSLTTSATGGGSVTPGGSYPYGTVVTLAAVADQSSRFAGWSGDANGATPTATVTMIGPRTVHAVFVPKTAQSITFTNPGSRPVSSPPFALGATASSGLPITYTVLSGPAAITGDEIRITGPGEVTVQANQAGNAFYLPAPTVVRTFNSVAPAVVKLQGAASTLVQSPTNGATANIVLETP